jgi:hypothetical protein
MEEAIDEHNSQKLLSEPKHIRQDLKHMELVIRANPIEIPQAIIEAMPKVTGTIMIKGKPREQLAAGRLLLAFLEYNQRLNEAGKPNLHLHQHQHGENTSGLTSNERRQANARRIDTLKRLGRNG